MVLLFKPYHIEPILNGKKVRTTRIWKIPRVKVGGVYQARTTLFGKPFALLEVTDVWRQEFNSLLLEKDHAEKEGGYSTEEYRRMFFEINPKVAKLTGCGALPFNVWVVEFKLHIRVVIEDSSHRNSVSICGDDWRE